jgi:hypothetical protein
LTQIVSAIPLAHWQAELRRTPADLIRAALAGKWPRTLLSAFAAAAGRQGALEWAEALLDLDDGGDRAAAVLDVLPTEQALARLDAAVAANDEVFVAGFLRRWSGEWDEARGRLVLDYLVGEARAEPEGMRLAQLRYQTRPLGHRLPPHLAPEAAAAAATPGLSRAWETALRHVAAVLAARLAMHRMLGLGAHPQT